MKKSLLWFIGIAVALVYIAKKTSVTGAGATSVIPPAPPTAAAQQGTTFGLL